MEGDYGWVLMGNHYHLLVETPRANLVKGMQWLQTAYTVWFNRRHDLTGHLFGGRYKAVLIDEGEPQGKMLYGYVGTVLDYLHLNPVRAGIVGGTSGKQPAGLSLEQPDRGISLQSTETTPMGKPPDGVLLFWVERQCRRTAAIFGAPRAKRARRA